MMLCTEDEILIAMIHIYYITSLLQPPCTTDKRVTRFIMKAPKRTNITIQIDWIPIPAIASDVPMFPE